jgi:WD40 repeat protein
MTTSPRTIASLTSLALLLACDTPTDQHLVGIQAHSFANSEWSEPVNFGPPINTAFVENNAELSPDGLSLYFGSNRPGGFGLVDIWVSRRACGDCSWEEPVNLGPIINSSAGDAGPGLSHDGHLLFLSSDRTGGHGGNDIYMSRRANRKDDFGWGPLVNLGPDVNTPAAEANPTYLQSAEDGAGNLYFGRGSTVNNQDIYYAPIKRDGVTRGPAVAVAELNASDPLVNDAAPTVRADGREILFHSTRPGGPGEPDMWVSTRRSVHDPWSPPVLFEGPLNSAFLDQQATLASNGRTLLFTSLRPGGQGVQDIWMSSRTPSGH